MIFTNPGLRQNGLSLGFLCRDAGPFVATALSKAELQEQNKCLQINELYVNVQQVHFCFQCDISKE